MFKHNGIFYNVAFLLKIEIINGNSFNVFFLNSPAINLNRSQLDELRKVVLSPNDHF